MFIEALFTIAKTWKESKYPLTDEWMKLLYIHTMEYYSAIKNNGILPIYSNMVWPREYHFEWSKSEKDKYGISLVCVI